MLRPPSLARLLVLAVAAWLAPAARAEEPRAAAGAEAKAEVPASTAPEAKREATAREREPGAAAPSLAPRLTPAPAAAPSADRKQKPAAAAPAGPVLTVAEIAEDTVRLAGPNVGLAPKQVGRVVARDGATVGRVEIERVLENGVVARVISGRENVAWGARVRFDAQAK